MCFAEWAPADPTVRTGRSPRRTKRRIIYKEFIFLNATSPETKSRPGVTGLACGCQQAMTKQKANPHVHVHFLGEALCIYNKSAGNEHPNPRARTKPKRGMCLAGVWRTTFFFFSSFASSIVSVQGRVSGHCARVLPCERLATPRDFGRQAGNSSEALQSSR